MKLVQVTSSALAALLAVACAASNTQSSAPERAAVKAEEDREAAKQQAVEARKDANKEKQEAAEATQREREAERNAELARQRASLAEAQASHETQVPGKAQPGITERQADVAGKAEVGRTTVLFPPNSADLSADAKARLDEVAKSVRGQSPARKFVVEGYSDDAAGDPATAKISQDRAREVGRYLESQGIATEHIAVKGMGSHHPVTSDATDRGRALNRRVEIIIQSR